MEKVDIERFLAVSHGSGSGDGSGYGSGYGDGDGYGIKQFNGEDVYYIDGLPCIFDSIKGNFAQARFINNDFSLKPCYIAKEGNFFAHGDSLAEALSGARQKYNENRPLSERIASFKEVYPSLESEGTGEDFYSWHHVLTGSCEFGRREFCKQHEIELNATYTAGYFLELTKNSFGSDAIKQTMMAYAN